MAQAPLDRSLARPTDAPPLAHEATDEAPVGVSADAEAPLLPPDELPRHVAIGDWPWPPPRLVRYMLSPKSTVPLRVHP